MTTVLQERADVLVVGGGPAGSTAAALLAEEGWRVALLDKDRHPRFHVGESLLPLSMPILDRLGVSEAVRAIGVLKLGADFTCPVGGRHAVRFANASNPGPTTAFQVKRAEFDGILLDNARSRGVAVHEGAVARRVSGGGGSGRRGRGGASGRRAPALAGAREVVDASGMAGGNYLLIGDAFVDPIFSSGVHFAMTGARLRGADDAPRWVAGLERRVREGLATMSRLIVRFNSPALRRLFLHPRDVLGIGRAILAIVAGDVFGRTRPGFRFALFKLIYYVSTAMDGRAGWRHWRRRRRDVELALTGGPTAPRDDG